MSESQARLICPECGLYGPPELFLGEASKRQAVVTAINLPAPLGPQIIAYLGLHRPAKRYLSWSKTDRLLKEILEQLQAGTIRRKNQTLSAPITIWQAALDDVLMNKDKIDLPLTGNGYLFAVVHRMANSAEGQAERAKEEHLKQRAKPVASTGAPDCDQNRQFVRDMVTRGFKDRIPDNLRHLIEEKDSD